MGLKLLYNWKKGATSYWDSLDETSLQTSNMVVVYHSISKAIFALPSAEQKQKWE